MQSTIHIVYANYRNEARRRNREFSINVDDFYKITQQNCVYCGTPPRTIVKSKKKGRKEFYYNGIDRIDNNLGYVVGNMAPCCKLCNQLKRKLTVKEFLNHVKNIYLFQEKLNGSGC